MTSRNDLNRLSAARRRIVELAQRDLATFFYGLNLSRPELVRDALLEVVPTLVREYGDLAAVAAAEWYEEVRAAQVGGTYNARLAGLAPDRAVEGSVRWASGHLFDGDPTQALANLTGAIQRHISYGSRATVARNAELDPARPRFARVPRGTKTCTFCSLMASRGFVYRTAELAEFRQHDGEEYHDACRCEVVAEFDREQHHIAGYDPDDMYEKYLAAREATGTSNPKEILATMRRMFPNDFTDGVHAHAA